MSAREVLFVHETWNGITGEVIGRYNCMERKG